MIQEGGVPFEVIIIDGTKEGASLQHLPLEHVTVLRAKSLNPFAMFNEALALAKGMYIHFLNPGEFYIAKKTLAFMKKMIHAHDFPDLLNTDWMIRHSFGQPTVDTDPLQLCDLKRAHLPTSLQPFWLRKDSLLMLGGFQEKYTIQGGYDLICRYFKAPTLRKAFVRRIMTDYEYRKPSSKWIFHQWLETFWISLVHFGPSLYLLGWLIENALRLMRFSWKIFCCAFWKHHVAY